MLQLTAEQREQLADLQESVSDSIEKILTAAQRKKLQEPLSPAVVGFVPPGEILPAAVRAALETSADQNSQLDALQKSSAEKLSELLSQPQRKQLQDMRDGFARGGPFGLGPGRGPGPGGPPGRRGGPGGPGRPGGPGFAGGPGFGAGPGSSLFRVYRYAVDYPGLAGKTLTPGKKLEEIEVPAGGPPGGRPPATPSPAPTPAASARPTSGGEAAAAIQESR
jgi:hypothetical protein